LHAQLHPGYEYKSVMMLRDENISIVYSCKFQKRCTQYAGREFCTWEIIEKANLALEILFEMAGVA
jgi:hypothetical protein